MVQSIFAQLFALINENLFGGVVDFTAVEYWQPLICGLFAAFGAVFMVSLPFLLVYWLTRFISTGLWQ